jgi:hypothetical protein
VRTSTIRLATATACTASTTSLECGEAKETHEQGGQNGCEYDSVIVPERKCSEHKKIDELDQGYVYIAAKG